MKGTTDTTAPDGGRRGLFRRSRRTDDAAPSTAQDAVATVDELARKMEALAQDGQGRSVADDPVRAEFDLQRAVIARANDLAAMAAVPTTDDASTTDADLAPEAPMTTQPTTPQDQYGDEIEAEIDDIEARLDAALQPIATPQATTAAPGDAGTVTLDPTPPTTEAAAPQQDAVLAPVVADHPSAGVSAASSIGIDVDRVVRLIEEEALGVHHRIELELRAAQARAEEIVDQAEVEAERIREHGQAQARVLLGEVEEIISEAQQTGEQILLRANEEASTLRGDATNVLAQAQTEARAIVETARREGEQVLAEQRRLATVRAQEAMREQDRLKDQIRRLEERRRQVLESLEPLISQLTQMMPAAGQAGAAVPQNVVQLQRQQPAAKG